MIGLRLAAIHVYILPGDPSALIGGEEMTTHAIFIVDLVLCQWKTLALHLSSWME